MGHGYILMHGDEKTALLDVVDTAIVRMRVLESAHLPFLGRADIQKLRFWLKNRSIPQNREDLKQLLRDSGSGTSEEFLFKNLALSLTDWYWLCPVELDLSWADVNLFSYTSSRVQLEANSFSSDASLGGQMSKYWDLSDKEPVLVKHSSAWFGQQCINEKFASYIHEGQGIDPGRAVTYETDGFDGMEAACRCRSFVTEGLEFIPAYEVCSSVKKSNSLSEYESFIRICEQGGLTNVRDQMEYMLLSDFALTNEDRHFYNFGILRDAKTLAFISLAPIFDSGNSMFYRCRHVLSRQELLEIEITSFQKREEKVIRYVRNRGVLDRGKLPEPEEVFRFYLDHHLPRERAELIAANYEVKLALLEDYQNGASISGYREKQTGTL